MHAARTILLVLIYPLLIVGRVLNGLLRRDPLRLHEPEGDSLWIERPSDTQAISFFSEHSRHEGSGHGGCGWLAAAALSAMARMFAPPRSTTDPHFCSAIERDQSIPDEVYTLW
jgi:hypothetical protein